jgi:hypothetical protein
MTNLEPTPRFDRLKGRTIVRRLEVQNPCTCIEFGGIEGVLKGSVLIEVCMVCGKETARYEISKPEEGSNGSSTY